MRLSRVDIVKEISTNSYTMMCKYCKLFSRLVVIDAVGTDDNIAMSNINEQCKQNRVHCTVVNVLQWCTGLLLLGSGIRASISHVFDRSHS